MIAFVFACYILLQKEKLSIQIRKVMFAYLPQSRVEWMLDICSLTYRTFSSFLTGQCLEALILGVMFFVVMTIIQMPYALLVGVLIAFTALIPIFGAFIGCFIGTFLILMVDPLQALIFCNHVFGPAADRRKSDLPQSSWKFSGSAVYLGIGGSQHRRQFTGSGRYADLYSARICGSSAAAQRCI